MITKYKKCHFFVGLIETSHINCDSGSNLLFKSNVPLDMFKMTKFKRHFITISYIFLNLRSQDSKVYFLFF